MQQLWLSGTGRINVSGQIALTTLSKMEMVNIKMDLKAVFMII